MEPLAEASVSCPYCGELIVILLDCSIPEQEYIEDCQVCCNPMTVALLCSDPTMPIVTVTRDDE